MTDRTIHFWVPDIRQGSGGIQAFCRDAAGALLEAYPQARLHLHIKNDRPDAGDPLIGGRVTWSSACRVSGVLRTMFYAVSGILKMLWQRPRLVLSGHVNFMPAVHLLRPGACKTAVVLHGIEAWQLQEGATLEALGKADALISVSRFTRDRVAGFGGVDPRRLFVLPNTFQPERYQPGPKPADLLQRYGLEPGQPVLLTVGRLAETERYKGHREVIEALPRLLPEFPGLRYLIAGQGDYARELKHLASELSVADHVVFTGFVSNEEMAAHYRLCDVFVMPSRGEGFGIVFLEAMACGKPVIAGNADGSRDAVDDGRLGVLVDPESQEEIARALRDVLRKTHPNRLLFDPQRLHDEVVRTFGPEAFRSRLKAIMDRLLEE